MQQALKFPLCGEIQTFMQQNHAMNEKALRIQLAKSKTPCKI
jgi:hypothetical protein